MGRNNEEGERGRVASQSSPGMVREDARHGVFSTEVVSKELRKIPAQRRFGYSRDRPGLRSCGVLLGVAACGSVTFGEGGNGVLKTLHLMSKSQWIQRCVMMTNSLPHRARDILSCKQALCWCFRTIVAFGDLRSMAFLLDELL